jgi:Rrf2 family transcriptional regulator, cysteine metabolism repressor
MKLTARSEYALLALIYMARNQSNCYVPVETIATAQDIPAKFLEQIMLALKNARYLQSSKGLHGGYRLARAPDSISLAEVIRLFNGALAPTHSASRYFYESTPIEKESRLIGIFRELRDLVSERLERTTIADVC